MRKHMSIFAPAHPYPQLQYKVSTLSSPLSPLTLPNLVYPIIRHMIEGGASGINKRDSEESDKQIWQIRRPTLSRPSIPKSQVWGPRLVTDHHPFGSWRLPGTEGASHHTDLNCISIATGIQ